MIPLTLRAMSRTRHPRARASARPAVSLLSVLALLAMACFPGLAQAEEATGPQYESEVPNVPGRESSKKGDGSSEPSAREEAEAEASGGTPGGGSGGGDGSREAGGNKNGQGSQAPGGGGGQAAPGSGPAGKGETGAAQVGLAEPVANASDDDGSSPLVPILIAVAVLAAITIGGFYYRQRRQGSGSPISPKAS